MPRASRTSAEPQFEVTARLPCLATMVPDRPGGSGDERGGGGDVEGAAGVAAGAAGIDKQGSLFLGQRHGDGGGAHGVDEAGELGGGFAAGGQGSEQCGELGCRTSSPARGLAASGLTRPLVVRVSRPSMICFRYADAAIRFKPSIATDCFSGDRRRRLPHIWACLRLPAVCFPSATLGCRNGANPLYEDSRVPGKRDSAEVRRARARRRDGDDARRGRHARRRRCSRRASGRGGEGADPCGRPRQGRRREGGRRRSRMPTRRRRRSWGCSWSRTRPGRRGRRSSGC